MLFTGVLLGCRNATLVRLARKLGYKGFAEMKPDMFKSEAELSESPVFVPAAELIKKSQKILFAGSGDAHLIAYAGHLKFHKAGYYSMCSSDFDDQLMNVSRLGRGDTLIAISHSGITKTVCELVKCAKRHGANVITVTAYPLSRLAKMSDITIITPTFTENLYDEVVSKRIPVLAIMEVLFLMAVNKGDASVHNCLQRANLDLESNKLTSRQSEHLW